MPADAWDRVFSVNVTGTFMMTQAFARHCVARDARDAAIVEHIDRVGQEPPPGRSGLQRLEAAVETMSKAFAMELGPHGIRVNAVAPGYIDDRGWSDAYPDRAADDLRAALVQSIPLGQAGHPRDIAAAVLFLASDDAGHVTGAVLEVDGGSNAGRSPGRTPGRGAPATAASPAPAADAAQDIPVIETREVTKHFSAGRDALGRARPTLKAVDGVFSPSGAGRPWP